MMGMKISYLQSAELEGSQKIKVKKEGNIDPNIESLNIDSQRCSVRFRSGEHAGQSVVLILSSSRHRLHTRHIRPGITPGGTSTHCTTIGCYNESKNLSPIPNSSQGAIA